MTNIQSNKVNYFETQNEIIENNEIKYFEE